MRRTLFALLMLALSLASASHAGASPFAQTDEAADEDWLQNHADVTLWSDNTSSAQAFATISRFEGFFQAQKPFRTQRGRIFVYYPGDILGVQPGYAWVELSALGPAGAPPDAGLLYRPPPPAMYYPPGWWTAEFAPAATIFSTRSSKRPMCSVRRT